MVTSLTRTSPIVSMICLQYLLAFFLYSSDGDGSIWVFM